MADLDINKRSNRWITGDFHMSLDDKIHTHPMYKDGSILNTKDVREAVKELKDKYPCCMKKRKCIKDDLSNFDRNFPCTNCRFRFKIEQIFGEELVK